MAKVWRREELTDEALIEAVGFVRYVAEHRDLPHHVVLIAQNIAAILPPLVDSADPDA